MRDDNTSMDPSHLNNNEKNHTTYQFQHLKNLFYKCKKITKERCKMNNFASVFKNKFNFYFEHKQKPTVKTILFPKQFCVFCLSLKKLYIVSIYSYNNKIHQLINCDII